MKLLEQFTIEELVEKIPFRINPMGITVVEYLGPEPNQTNSFRFKIDPTVGYMFDHIIVNETSAWELSDTPLTNFQKVQEFHQRFNCLISNLPRKLNQPELQSRWNLIEEEFKELQQEITAGAFATTDQGYRMVSENYDPANTVKEICDLLYVLYGYAVNAGVDLDKAFDEVHRSNMSKLGEDGKAIFRPEDGKVLKGPNYFKADMRKYV